MFHRLRLLYILASVVLFVATVQTVEAQQSSVRIKIERANYLRHDDKIGKNTQSLNGDVVLSHHNTVLHCDSAYMYNDSNYVVAYGSIHIIQNDSIHLYGDRLMYYGDMNLAKVRDNVKANKGTTWLYTDFLDYDRVLDKAYFFNGGRVVNGESTLTSDNGLYFPNTNDVYFKDDVVGTSPRYKMYSDTMRYNTRSEVVTILGPTKILTSDSVTIDSDKGWYNTLTDEAKLLENNSIWSGQRNLTGDVILYQRRDGLGTVWGNMQLRDTVDNMTLGGDYGFYNEITGEALATQKALATHVYGRDTLFLHADSFKIVPLADTSRLMKAYHNVKFFRNDMQGRCDSLVFDFRDSIATMYDFPVLWAQGNQMLANQIKVYTRNRAVYRADLIDAAFVVAPELDSVGYNQIKGKLMNGYIRNNELYLIDVDGNGQTIYYPKDGEVVIGMNKAESSNMSIWLKDRKVQNIIMRVSPTGNMNPPVLLSDDARYLKGFRWLDDYRPKTKDDIFLRLDIPAEMTEREEVYEGYTFDEVSK